MRKNRLSNNFFGAPSFRLRYLEETIVPDGGGGGGAPVVETPPKETPPVETPPKETPLAKPGMTDEERQEFDDLKKFKEGASAHVETDPTTGAIRARVAPGPIPIPSPEQIADAERASAIASQAARISETNRRTEEKIINEFKSKDPLFAKNLIAVRAKMDTIDPSQRTEAVWKRAWAMAQGENSDSYRDMYIAEGKKQAQVEFAKANGSALPAGGGSGSQGGEPAKVDLAKVVLSRDQVKAANQLIAGGFINTVDEYKENLVLLGEAEVED